MIMIIVMRISMSDYYEKDLTTRTDIRRIRP